MRMHVRQKHLSQSLMTAACLLMILLLPVPTALACSWDYPIWMIRRKSADPLYRFIQKGKAGYIDRSGKVVIKPKFEFSGNHGGEFHDGLLDVSFDQAGYADTRGRVVIAKRYSVAEDFSEGLAVVKLENPERWGYIDRTGEIVLTPRVEAQKNVHPNSFSEGLASLYVDKRYGYIDRSGKLVIQPKFLLASDFHDGMARVVVDGPCVFFEAGPCTFSPTILGKGLPGKVSDCKFIFIDKAGSVATEEYEGAKDFSEGVAPVMKGSKWGYIDKKGRMVIEPKFDGAEPFSDGMARVKQGELWGYIDHTGELSIDVQFEYAVDFSDGLAAVGKWNEEDYEDGDFYYIDKSGAQAIPEKFDLASHFFKGLAHVKIKSNKKSRDDDDPNEEVTFAYITVTGRKVFTYTYSPED